MTSATKANILKQHESNDLLNAPVPPLTQMQPTDLSADELPVPLDEQIIAGAGGALDDGHTHYVPVPGIEPLRSGIAEYINGLLGSAVEMGNVVVTAGIQESRFLTTQLAPGAKVAIPTCVHPGVRRALGVRPRDVAVMDVDADRLLPTLPAIEAALKDGCDLLFLEFVSRLSGAVFTSEEIEAIAGLVQANDAGVIWDHGMAPWVKGGAPSVMITKAAGRTAVIGEAFPGMGLASWFIGYIVAPTDWIPPMQKQKQVMAICTSTASQYAALEAAGLYSEKVPEIVGRLATLRAELAETATGAGLEVLVGGAVNVMALRLDEPSKVEALAAWADAGISVTDGTDFGAPNVVRLAVAPDGTTARALELLTA